MKKINIFFIVLILFLFVLLLTFIGKNCLRITSDNLPYILSYSSTSNSVVSVNLNQNRNIVLDYSQQIYPPVQCIPISTLHRKIPICVHDNPNEYITNAIRRTGKWESGISNSLQKILVENPDYGVVDIGANLGMYGLLAANLKRPALSIEAMDINIEKFHQSIVINHFEKLITLVTKPLSDKYETLQLTAGVSNLGMSRLLNAGQNMNGLDKNRYNTVNKTTVMLDDLIDLMPWKKAVMVIDVEGNEGKAIRGGQKFFDAVHISHIFMEWNLLNRKDRKFLVDFLSGRGYEPYSSPNFISKLELSKYGSWPINVYWKKTGTK